MTRQTAAAAHNRAFGEYGERLAARYLQEQRIDVLDTNWRCELGELDIVARDGRTLVFCEVKTRSSTAYGAPVEAVGRAKAARIHRLAARWMTEREARAGALRFDIVSVLAPDGRRPEITHLRDAF